MINCIAIDDEPLALTQLTGYISRVPFLNLVASCQDAFDAMSVLSAQKIDLMFVDINMPDLNGMDFVQFFCSVIQIADTIFKLITAIRKLICTIH